VGTSPEVPVARQAVIIECPSCMTRFRLDESRLSDQRPLLKCSRCQHVFALPGAPAGDSARPREKPRRPVERKPTRQSRPAKQDDAENLSFTFGDEEEEWKAEPSDEEALDEERFSLDSPGPDEDALLETPTREAAPLAEPEESEEETADAAGGGISLRPVFVFLFLVVTAYAVLAGTLYANPDFTDQIVRGVPVVGTSPGRLLNRKILLMDVVGSYERTRAGKEIFIVTGYTVNHAEFSLSSVQVDVQLRDSEGNVLQDRIVFCGSTVPRKLLRDLTVAEVSVLGRLKPPRTFLIRPGDRSPFMAVFADPPPAVTELSAQILAAQRQL